MSIRSSTISACLVVYNEEAVIRRCLESIKNLVDEIIIVHDGECSDKTLEIAREYTDKIFVEPHIGIAEPHRSLSFAQASSEWILQIDADEYFDGTEIEEIKKLTNQILVDGFYFKWELWNGKKTIYFSGLQKMVLFRKSRVTFQGLPQKEVMINGKKFLTSLHLHHKPIHENLSFLAAKKKRVYWLKAHVLYYFPALVTYMCFQTTIDSWLAYVDRVHRHPLLFVAWYPLKNFLGQLKNGLWRSRYGWQVALQQYVYYVVLYFKVWRMTKKLKLPLSGVIH